MCLELYKIRTITLLKPFEILQHRACYIWPDKEEITHGRDSFSFYFVIVFNVIINLRIIWISCFSLSLVKKYL